jgi:tRNA pseudouridine32 synthase/23S rRNA pseudouridine746 synthase
MDHLEIHIKIGSAESSFINLLRDVSGLSKQRIKFAMIQGAVWITRGSNTQRLRRAKRVLRVGDEVHLYYDAQILAEIPPEPGLVVDLGGYSVWNKPCGLRSQGSKWGDHCTIARWAERHLQPERLAFTVHRLDRAANGLMLIAHSKKVAAALSALFEKREMDKRYRAMVSGDFSEHPNPLRVELPIDGKEAVSEMSFQQISDDGSRSLVEVKIETGRKHQIRRHFAEIGHPVIGDRLYRDGEKGVVDLQLTAFQLGFHCPVKDEVVEYRLPILPA